MAWSRQKEWLKLQQAIITTFGGQRENNNTSVHCNVQSIEYAEVWAGYAPVA